jgi:gliding motility-associated-like protein
MKKILLLLSIVFTIFLTKEAKATHYAGGELIYEWIADSTFKFTAIMYRSCAYPSGTGGNNQSAAFGSTVTMCWLNTNNTAQFGSIILDSVAMFTSLPVSTGCPGTITQCTDLTSTIPGYEEWHYDGVLTLAGPSNLYRFWLSGLCCRNGGITNLVNPGGAGFHIEATLNWNAIRNTPNPTNSSPVFTAKPTPYICVNQLYSYNNQGIDVNGDSLVYTSVDPQTSGGSCQAPANGAVGYVFATPAYNPSNNPFDCNSTFAVNANSGTMQVIPASTGQVVVSVRCDEWRNGVVIGSMMRDIQINILPCTIANPVNNLQLNTVSNLSYNGMTGNYDGCVDSTISFCTLITGAVDTAALSVTTNAGVGTVLPGATVNMIGYGTDSVYVCITWTPTLNDTSLNIVTINYHDTACIYSNVSAVISFSLPIYIFPQTEAFGDTVVCANTPVQLSAIGGSVFNWDALPGGSGNASLSCTNCNNPIATPSVTTSYVLSSNLNTVCADSVDTVTIFVLPLPAVNPIPDDTLCSNGVYQINGTVSTPGNYSYTWAPAVPYLSSTTIPNPIITNPSQAGGQPSFTQTFTLTVSPIGFNSCSAKDTVTFTVLQGIDILNSDTIVCFGDLVNILTFGSPLYTYAWNPTIYLNNGTIKNPIVTPLVNTAYTLTASFAGCPDTTNAINIGVQPIPITNAGLDRLICAGDTLRMNGTVAPFNADPNFYTNTWKPAFDLSNANDLNAIFTGTATTTFTLNTVTSKGCKDSDLVVITVVPDDFINVGSNKVICPNETVTINASGAISYVWQPGIWLSDSLKAITQASPLSSETFTVIGTDINGCKDTASVYVFVAPEAILNAGPDVTLYPGETAYLNAVGNCSNFIWTPSFGLSSTSIQDPVATPSTTTQYVVNGTTEYGCATSDTVTVTRLNEGNIATPNAFTPGNGSGSNDVFKVDKNGIAKLNYLRIFNRWGELLFETTDINKGWDGSFKGKAQPMGTYMYTVDAQTISGKKYSKTGNVTLIR